MGGLDVNIYLLLCVSLNVVSADVTLYTLDDLMCMQGISVIDFNQSFTCDDACCVPHVHPQQHIILNVCDYSFSIGENVCPQLQCRLHLMGYHQPVPVVYIPSAAC